MLIRIYDTAYPIIAILVLLSLCAWPVIIFVTVKKYRKQAFRLLIKWIGFFVLGIGVLFSLGQAADWVIFQVQKPDREQIDLNYSLFQEAVEQGNYEIAYDFMSPEYRESNSLLDFQQEFIKINYFPLSNQNRFIYIREDHAVFSPDYDTEASFWQNSITFDWKKVKNDWYLTGQVSEMLD